MDAHNFKHYKNKKKGLKSQKNNGEPEVYVLPPDLLQKLGINLGSVNSDLQLPLDTNAKREFLDQEQIKNGHIMFSSNTDKTISETASLLKESMLIMGSPTLTPTLSRISREIEISNEAVVVNNVSKIAFNGTGKSEMNGKAHQNPVDTGDNADLKEKDANVSDDTTCIFNTADKIYRVDPTTDMKRLLITREHNLEVDKDENKNYYESTDGNKRLLKDKIRSMVINKNAINNQIDAKDHDILKLKNDYNDSNTEPVDSSDDLVNIPNCKSFKVSCPSSTSKISIISEEIVDCSKLRELSKMHSKNVSELMPVTINTVITAKKTDDSKNTQQKDFLNKTYSDESHKLNSVRETVTPVAINEINGNKLDKGNALENESYSVFSNIKHTDNNLMENQFNTLDKNEVKSIHSDGECTVNESLDEPNSIKHCHKKVLSPVDMNGLINEETNSNNLTYNECNEPTVPYSKNKPNIEQNLITTKSKLSVQGVEKPGGEQNKKQCEKIPQIVKTYQRCKRIAKPPPTQNIIHNLITISTNDVVSPSHEVCTKAINAIVCHEECKYQEFCICRDFGTLHFYDEIREYEHIHFWDRDIPNVDPELIFSIYDDEHCNRYPDNDLFCTNIGSEENSSESTSVCWNEYPRNESVKIKSESIDCNSCSEQSKNSYDNGHIKEISKHKSAPTDDNSLESENTELEKTNSKADKHMALCNNYEVQPLIQPNAVIQKHVTEIKESSSGENLASSDGNESSRQKESENPSDVLDSSNPKANTTNENNEGLLKNDSNKSLSSISVDGSKLIESPTELSTVNINKENSSDLPPEQIIIDVEIPIPKRKRGRPRKQVQPISDITCESTDSKADNQTNDTTLANISKTSIEYSTNNIVEDTPPSSRRTRRSMISVDYSEDANDESVRPSRLCSRRLNRNQSSNSTSTCNEDNITKDISENDDSDVQCGVCNVVIKSSDWMDHIGREHDYLAWKEGSKPLELNDELEVKNHLQNILKEIQALACYTCGIKRKYIVAYLKHRKTCDPNCSSVSLDTTGTIDPDDLNVSLETSKKNIRLKDSQGEVRCGVCNEVVKGTDWICHIQREHYYLAWADGETPLDLNDAEEVKIYLMALGKKLGGLTCHKCGLVRKYANIYLQHVKSCDAVSLPVLNGENCGDKVRCAVCSEEVMPKEWKNHAMSKHYNIAWIVGAPPIDVKNYYVVESYLKEYKNKYNKLKCKVCRDTKVSCCGFYAHIIQCGKTEEEIDKYREFCDICKKQYLCMYKSQHMTMHREKEYAIERKLKLAEVSQQVEEAQETVNETPGRRKAAEKARNVIAKYKEEYKSHNQKDTDVSTGYSSDSDVSVKLEQYTDDESDDTDDEDDISEEEERADRDKRKKRVVDSNAPTITRIPFPIKNVRSYIQESFEDFCNNYLTSEKLFPEWNDCEFHKLSEDELDKYMPPLKESCKVKVTHETWSTYKRFEVENNSDCITLFVGASIQCLSWCPVHLDDANGSTGNFLAVACHSGKDSPRYNCDEAPAHPNLLQIWDFGDLQSSPKLALGLAHDYGTIWAMDWCPSGARDLLKEDDKHSKGRLGLLSIACSNGSVYIFTIPHPSAITVNDEVFYKTKPVAELRLSSMVADERRYQATSLRWSPQKGHNTIMVGYSNGMVAYFDLSNESPLLVVKENGVTIVHPFYDERGHNSCVTGVDVYMCGAAACSASASGARLLCGAPPRAAPARLTSALACAGAFFLPHWPSAVLTAVNSKVNQTVNEVEWQGVAGRGGRRVGGVRAHAPCPRCAALAAADPPLLSVLHAHPAHYAHHTQHAREHDINKHVTAILQMTSLAQKRKQTNNELAMKLEPLTYDDAVQKYGIELQLVPRKNKASQQKALSTPMLHYPERFPLAEITSMSFCPAAMHHNRLAVGTHAGILFLINVS